MMRPNLFARRLLMPEDEYRDVFSRYTQGDQVDTKRIAQHFCVTPELARLRGMKLGLLEW